MARVGEARAHDAPVAGRDRRAAIGSDQVRDQDEFIGEFPGAVPEHETFLIGADGGANDFGRKIEERRLELAHEHDRPFDQARDFLEQTLVLNKRQPLGEGELFGIGEDDRLAPVGVEHDLRLVQRVNIIVVTANMNRLRRHEAMAPGHVARFKPVSVRSK